MYGSLVRGLGEGGIEKGDDLVQELLVEQWSKQVLEGFMIKRIGHVRQGIVSHEL